MVLTVVANCASMFYHNQKAFELVEASGLPYDVVVKYRADLVAGGDLPLQDCRCPDDTTVWVPEGADYGGLNDQVAMGAPRAMARYCALYGRMADLCASGTLLHPETLLAEHLRRCGVQARRFAFSWALLESRK